MTTDFRKPKTTSHGTYAKLHKAKDTKNDEFYTRIEDIEREMPHYRQHFKDKVVLLNCDDPMTSHFWIFFHIQASFLGIRKLISTHYHPTEKTYKLEFVPNGDGIRDGDYTIGDKTPLQGNGDFRSPECMALLKEADIVVTNPPFSLFREYIDTIIQHNKQFLIVGPVTAIAYKECFGYIKQQKMWLGCNRLTTFTTPEGEQKKLGNVCWFTNMEYTKRHELYIPVFQYHPEDYPKYDEIDAIEVPKSNQIPCNYHGLMGVPISYLLKHNPDQIEIVGLGVSPHINGKCVFKRILVRWKRVPKDSTDVEIWNDIYHGSVSNGKI